MDAKEIGNHVKTFTRIKRRLYRNVGLPAERSQSPLSPLIEEATIVFAVVAWLGAMVLL